MCDVRVLSLSRHFLSVRTITKSFSTTAQEFVRKTRSAGRESEKQVLPLVTARRRGSDPNRMEHQTDSIVPTKQGLPVWAPILPSKYQSLEQDQQQKKQQLRRQLRKQQQQQPQQQRLLPAQHSSLPEPMSVEKSRKKKRKPGDQPQDALDRLFTGVSECVSHMSSSSRSREEIRAKLRMGRRAEEVLRAQEERLKRGRPVSQRDKIG